MVRLFILALCMLTLAGCPREKRALEASRRAVEVTAQLVAIVDTEVSTGYTAAANDALVDCSTSDCYRGKMAKWDKTVVAVTTMKSSLLLVETSLDAWEAGSPNGKRNLLDAAACFVDTLVHLQSLLADVGARTATLTHAVAYADALFGLDGSTCPAGATP